MVYYYAAKIPRTGGVNFLRVLRGGSPPDTHAQPELDLENDLLSSTDENEEQQRYPSRGSLDEDEIVKRTREALGTYQHHTPNEAEAIELQQLTGHGLLNESNVEAMIAGIISASSMLEQFRNGKCNSMSI